MQYLVSVIDDNAGLATPEVEAAIDVFNDRLQAEGHWVFAGGLAAPSSATVIDNRSGEAMFTDGPMPNSRRERTGHGRGTCRSHGHLLVPAMASSRIVHNRRTRKS